MSFYPHWIRVFILENFENMGQIKFILMAETLIVHLVMHWNNEIGSNLWIFETIFLLHLQLTKFIHVIATRTCTCTLYLINAHEEWSELKLSRISTV